MPAGVLNPVEHALITNQRGSNEIKPTPEKELDEWTDKTTNQKRSKHKVVVESIEFLGSRSPDGGDGSGGRPMGNAGGKPAAGRSPNFPPPADDGGGDEYGGGEPGGDGDPIPF